MGINEETLAQNPGESNSAHIGVSKGTEPNRIESDPSEDDGGRQRPAIRLRTAALILVAMWLFLLVPGWLMPLTMLHFISMQLGPLLGALALSIWWLTSNAMPLRQRLAGLALIVCVFIAAMFSMHSSMRIVMLVYGLPVSLTLLVLGFIVSRKLGLPRQGWIGLIAFSILMVGSLFTRVGSIDADFQFVLVPRWRPTAEEMLIARGSAEVPSPAMAFELPDNAGEADWAEFRGTNRDSILTGVSFGADWESNPPKELWRRPIGPGWSSFCIVHPLLFTQEQRGENELISAYSVADGKPVWTNQTESRFEASMGGIGPRATPTYRDKQLYTLGASGLVQCLDAATGNMVWQFDLVKELGVPLPQWGFASSPLVLKETAIVFAGGGEENAMVALDRMSGKVVWSIGFGSHGYSSPQLSVIDGVAQVLMSSNRGVQSVDPATGQLLWRHDWDIGEMARITQPTVVDTTVYLGTGYGNGTMRIDIQHDGDAWTTVEKWTKSMKPYFNDCVFHDGYLYGFDGRLLVCLDAETGDNVWKRRGFGHGQVLMVRDMETLLVTTEEGELVLVKASPDKLEEIARISSVNGITWNHPVIAQRKLFVRNAEEMVCYELDVVH